MTLRNAVNSVAAVLTRKDPPLRRVTLQVTPARKITLNAPAHLLIPRLLEEEGLKGYEPHALACALALCATREGAFYDVGANVGVFSLVVSAALGRSAYAFEPTPDIAQIIEDTALQHALPITVSRTAASDKTGTATFFLSDQSDASSSLNPDFRRSSVRLDVETDKLDNIVKERPALIKIDTETTEPQVLAGAVEVIARHRPHLIVEVLPKRTEEEIGAFFAERGYYAYHITSKPFWKVQPAVRGDTSYENNNWLFAPEPLSEAFWTHMDAWRWRISRA